ncbi:MAG: hypothetical protein EHM70_17880 [Chloroflexota bacterium]|nr:MAG: hypothetical protein EHM70_17880 [Chloroflexota bacterium]
MNYQTGLIAKWALAGLLLLGFASACMIQAQPQVNRDATVEAMSTAILGSATAGASQAENPAMLVGTAQAQATQRSQAAQVTQAAQSQQDRLAQEATTTALAPYQVELTKYGVDPDRGRFAWVHPPTIIDIEGYLQYDYTNQFAGTVVQDFVMSSDIHWNTDYGTSGCGFALRSDGNQDASNQYLAIITRAASGHLIFATMANGEVVTGRDIYAYGIDPNFEWENDTTNRLTVVGRGNRFTVYTNGILLGEIDPTAPPPQPYIPPPPVEPTDPENQEAIDQYRQARVQYEDVVNQIRAAYSASVAAYETADMVFDRGFVALVALTESGKTICEFDNTWLWLIED